MIIRRYAQHPMLLVPDVGEVIDARPTRLDPWLRAVVTYVRRRRNGHVSFTVYWLEDYPRTETGQSPIKAGQRGWITVHPDQMGFVIRQR